MVNAPPLAPVTPRRTHPLMLVALVGTNDRASSELVRQIEGAGAVVYETHGARGCLRVATFVGPDRILLDPRLPAGLINQLAAHPMSARAVMSWIA